MYFLDFPPMSPGLWRNNTFCINTWATFCYFLMNVTRKFTRKYVKCNSCCFTHSVSQDRRMKKLIRFPPTNFATIELYSSAALYLYSAVSCLNFWKFFRCGTEHLEYSGLLHKGHQVFFFTALFMTKISDKFGMFIKHMVGSVIHICIQQTYFHSMKHQN